MHDDDTAIDSQGAVPRLQHAHAIVQRPVVLAHCTTAGAFRGAGALQVPTLMRSNGWRTTRQLLLAREQLGPSFGDQALPAMAAACSLMPTAAALSPSTFSAAAAAVAVARGRSAAESAQGSAARRASGTYARTIAGAVGSAASRVGTGLHATAPEFVPNGRCAIAILRCHTQFNLLQLQNSSIHVILLMRSCAAWLRGSSDGSFQRSHTRDRSDRKARWEAVCRA